LSQKKEMSETNTILLGLEREGGVENPRRKKERGGIIARTGDKVDPLLFYLRPGGKRLVQKPTKRKGARWVI